jgi:hypothetical protein
MFRYSLFFRAFHSVMSKEIHSKKTNSLKRKYNQDGHFLLLGYIINTHLSRGNLMAVNFITLLIEYGRWIR